jgi:tetratricopeptide (TPR) repeat protein
MSPAPLRYRAFLSYCHRDAVTTALLHRRLEAFRVPRRLRRIEADADADALPPRLHPIFRDRDELASSGRLSSSIERALDESEALIVVCSPAAVASPWVGQEIAYFRRRYPDRPVLAFVVGGDPGRDPRIDPEHAAFPLALLVEDADLPGGALGEPLAADARAEGDGFAHAFLKLVAGLLGVRYDDLRRRDQRRRQRRWMLAFVAALALSAVFAFLAWDATRARDAARAAQQRAELELLSEQQTREFLISVFQLADANEARGNEITVREVLDRAVQRIDRTRFDRPAIRARFLATLGQAYSSLGLNRRGAELLQRAVTDLDPKATDPDARRQRIDSGIELADTLFDMGEYEPGLAALDAVDVADPDTRQRVLSANVRGEILSYLERDAEADAAYRQAMAIAATLTGDADFVAAERARSLAGLATLAAFAGDAKRAEEGFAESVRLLDGVFGADHPRTISATISLGSASYQRGRRDAAREAWTRALALADKVYEPGGPQAGTLRNNLGLLLLEEGDLAAAEPLLRESLASDRRHRGADFDDLAYPLHNLGYLLLSLGQLDAAEALLREALPIAEASGHRMLGPILNALADLECARGQIDVGAPLAQRAVELGEAAGVTEADAWRAAQARLTRASCGVATPTLQRDLRVVSERWPQSGNPFVKRAKAQVAAAQR